MNTFTKKLRAGALGFTLVSTCLVALPVYAQDSVTVTTRSRRHRNRKTSVW